MNLMAAIGCTLMDRREAMESSVVDPPNPIPMICQTEIPPSYPTLVEWRRAAESRCYFWACLIGRALKPPVEHRDQRPALPGRRYSGSANDIGRGQGLVIETMIGIIVRRDWSFWSKLN